MAHLIPSYYRYVESITITDAGSGYTSIPTITISGGGGTGATATAAIFNGSIQTITVTNIGSGYTSTPTVTVDGNAVLTAVLNFAQGPSTEYNTKQATLVDNTIPEFVREDHPKFKTFIETYYKFMDQEGNPSNVLLNSRFTDLDEASNAYLEKWRKAIAHDFPAVFQADKKFLYKNLKDLYETKGSKRSIQAFFRILYGEEIEVEYPSRYVLRASDGRWLEETTVKAVEGPNGTDVSTLAGKLVDVKYYETIGTVTTIKTIQATVQRVEKTAYTNPQSYELVLTLPSSTTVIPGPGAGLELTITETAGVITNIGIANGGSGYVATPTIIIHCADGNGVDATALLTTTDGVVTGVSITDGGSGYTSPYIEIVEDNFRTFVTLRDRTNESSNIEAYLIRTLRSVTSGSAASTPAGFRVGDVFVINETGDDGRGYALDYFSEDYTFIGGNNNAFIKVETIDSNGIPTSWSIINPGSNFFLESPTIQVTSVTGVELDIILTTGYYFSYPGKYTDDRGKLSDVNRLQDNNRYQSYSYVIKTGNSSSDWIEKYKEVLHPAGMEVFGDLIIKNTLNFTNYSIASGVFDINRYFQTDAVTLSDSLFFTWYQEIADSTVSITDVIVVAYNKGLSDTTSISDDGTVFNFGKNITETATTSDATFVINNSKNITETQTASEQIALSLTKPSVTDTATTSDSGSLVVQDYAESYFANDYVGVGRTFT